MRTNAEPQQGGDGSCGAFRLELHGQLNCLAPLHIGTGEAFALKSDAPVLRDAQNCTYIPGSSLKGILRAHLTREACVLGCDMNVVRRLFGGATPGNDSDSGAASRLTIFDSVSAGDEQIELRDHVAINPLWGAAETGAKYDSEVVLPGPQIFGFHAVYEGDSERDDELILVKAAVRFLESGDARIGAKSGWGYGKIMLNNLEMFAFRRNEADGLISFLNYRLNSQKRPPAFQFATREKTGRSAESPMSAPFAFIEMDLSIQFEGPALVKSSLPPDPSAGAALRPKDLAVASDYPPFEKYAELGQTEADHVFISRGGRNNGFYLPGSSLRGVLRSQALRICYSRFGKIDIAKDLFGWANEQDEGGQNGRIEVFDGGLGDQGEPIYLDHVAIDRITNFAIAHKKFSTCGLESPRFDTMLRVRFLDDSASRLALALLGFVLRDLIAGRLWVGSGTARGFGYVKSGSITRVRASIPEQGDFPKIVPSKSYFGRRVLEQSGFDLPFDSLEWLWHYVNPSWQEEKVFDDSTRAH